MENKIQEPTEQQLLETIDYGVKFYNVWLFISFAIYLTYVLITNDFSKSFLSIMVYLAIIIDACSLRGLYKLMFVTSKYNTTVETLDRFKENSLSSINRTRVLKLFLLIVIIINIFTETTFSEIFLLSTLFVACILSIGVNKTAVAYLEKLKN